MGVTMLRLPEDEWRQREGFALTDRGSDLTGALDQANYCIWCHNQGKDSCATGLREKDGSFKKTVFGVTLAGWHGSGPRRRRPPNSPRASTTNCVHECTRSFG